MKLAAIILSILVTAEAKSVEKNQDGVLINGVHYEKEILKDGLTIPSHFAMDHTTDNLYFTHYMSNVSDYLNARFDINTKEIELITGVENGFTQTVDPNTHDVYIGGNDGIYKYDRENKKAERFFANKNRIHKLFFKDNLYFVEAYTWILYKVSNGEKVKVKDFEDIELHHLFIDSKDTFFYGNNLGLFYRIKGSNNSVIVKRKQPVYPVIDIAADMNNNVYTVSDDGIYVFKKDEGELEKVYDGQGLHSFAFDSHNNIVFGDYTKIVLLKAIKDKTD
ncbi:hypothetical protein O0L34_g10275 [Tuta absoluta]|nr:hypothetical protein O0L34_g10275 [Tuta absoluta]